MAFSENDSDDRRKRGLPRKRIMLPALIIQGKKDSNLTGMVRPIFQRLA